MVTKKTLIRDIEEMIPHSNAIFSKFGMGKVGALVVFFDTVGESALANGVDPDLVVAEINQMPESSLIAF